MREEGHARCKRRSVVLAMLASFLLLLPATALAASATYPVGPSPASLAEGDFNRDGITDLVTPNTGPFDDAESKPDSISILLGRRDGSFAPERRYRVGAGPTDVAVGDFDEDGREDLVVTNAFSGTFSILLGRGDGTFDKEPRSYAVQDRETAPNSVAVGDIDGDGHLDVAIGSIFSGDVSVRYSSGDGTFSEEQTLATGRDGTGDVVIADLNHDGRKDIVVATFSVDVFLNAGGRSFLPRQRYGNRPSSSVSVGDFNGDGNPDLVTANEIGDGDEEDETDRTQTVTVLLGTGTGVFGPPRRYKVGRGPVHVAVGDLNGDGRPDLLASNHDFHGAVETLPFQPLVDSDYVSILHGRGDGTLEPQVKVPTGDGPIASVIADFDRDGRSDFAVALAGEDAVQVFITGDDDRDGGSRNGNGAGQQPEGGVDAGFGGGHGGIVDGNAGADRFFAAAGREILRLVDWVAGNDFGDGGARRNLAAPTGAMCGGAVPRC